MMPRRSGTACWFGAAGAARWGRLACSCTLNAIQSTLPRPRMSLHVTLLRARGLRRADCVWAGHGESTAYATVRLLPDGAKRTSHACAHTKDPEWNEAFVFDAPPGRAAALVLKVWDANPLLHKEFLGQAVLPLPPPPRGDDLHGVAVEEAWHALAAGDKHAADVAARLKRQGAPGGDLGAVLLRLERRAPTAEALLCAEGAEGGQGQLPRGGDDVAQQEEELYLHVDVSAARNLLPADVAKGKDKLTSSDPYCVLKLWPVAAHEPDHSPLPKLPLPRSVALPGLGRRVPILPPIPKLTRPGAPGDEEAAERDQSATKRRTRVVNDSLDPVWDQAFSFRPNPLATHVKVTLYDKDAIGNADDYLGEVLLPIPAQQPCKGQRHRDDDVARREGAAMTEGWFDLTCGASHAAELRRLLRRLGRPEELEPPALGQLYGRVSYGPERYVVDADATHRPSLRSPLGTLTLRVLAAKDLPDRPGADAYAVHVEFEQQRGCTPAAKGGGRSQVWLARGATFEWSVTEPTSDVILRVMDRHTPVGEVLIPLASLLPLAGSPLAELAAAPRAVPPSPRWFTILKPRRPGDPLLRTRSRPAEPLGRICVALRLRLHAPLPFCYLAPEYLPPTPPPGHNSDAEPSVAHLTLAAGRLADAILAPAVAPLRTVLYLQSWQAPGLNLSIAMLLLLACTAPLWPLARALWPLWLALSFAFNGYVSYLIHRADPVYVWRHEAEHDASAQRAARDRERLQRMHMEAERDARRARGENAPDPTAAQSRNVVILWRMINAQIQSGQAACSSAADALERAANLLSWVDPHASAVAALALAVTGLGASVALLLLRWWAALSPMGARHVTLALGAACLAPFPGTIRRVLDDLERHIQLNAPIAIGPLTTGAGLEATAMVRPGASVEEVRGRIAREAAAAEAAQRRRAEAAREARAKQRGAAVLSANPMEALRKLASRAPTNARVEHLRIAARTAAPALPAPARTGPGATRAEE